MNRTEFQALAQSRVTEADALLTANLWDGAYYLAGYAVECGLKACILKRVEHTGVIFEERKFAEDCWTHDLAKLMKLAGLESDRVKDASTNPSFQAAWETVCKWSEVARYRSGTDEPTARGLFNAITNTMFGVLRWIEAKW